MGGGGDGGGLRQAGEGVAQGGRGLETKTRRGEGRERQHRISGAL